MTSTQITRIEVGDTITFGLGTLNVFQRTVTEIEHKMTRESNFYLFTLDDGHQIFRSPEEWAEVTKATATAQKLADAVATAYATAWDSKR
jgi:hypothetical protein